MTEMISLESIKKNKYDVKELAQNIYLIKDFITNQEVKKLIEIIKVTEEKDWQLHNDGLSQNFQNKFYDHDDLQLQRTICGKIQNICTQSPDKIEISGYRRILRQKVGEHMEAHIDELKDSRNLDREYAVVIYINDNYEGGELSFLNKNINIKPPSGSAMVFKTGPEYLHTVRTVLGQEVRYCLPGFIFSLS